MTFNFPSVPRHARRDPVMFNNSRVLFDSIPPLLVHCDAMSPMMVNAGRLLMLLAACSRLGCATQEDSQAKSPTLARLVNTHEPPGGPAVEVDLRQGINAKKGEGRMTAWFGYAVTRRQWRLVTFGEQFGSEATYRYSFDEEVEARTNASLIWSETGAKKRNSDPYLAAVEAIRSSGFMREYVWACVPHPDWPEPGNLRRNEFAGWMSSKLPKHQVETWVKVIPSSTRDRWIVGVAGHPRVQCDPGRE